ncbi:hypothetical protein SDC9_204702 [bioreactor metagenome]|uniref:Uncharacterized protein n=1 Tax=bioreactor metagenome TaxID=1076179 RepID=A0A645J007_9ZZZZ
MQFGCRPEGAALDQPDRYLNLQALEQLADRIGQRIAAGQEDRRQVREAVGAVRGQQTGQQVGAVGRRHDRALRLEAGQHIGQGHAGHHGAQRFAVER